MNAIESPEGIQRIDGFAVVRPTGELERANVSALEAAWIERLTNADAGLIVDLSDVTYIGSAAIRLLLRLRTLLQERRQHLAIVLPEGSLLRRALEVAGVPDLVPVRSSYEAAISAGH